MYIDMQNDSSMTLTACLIALYVSEIQWLGQGHRLILTNHDCLEWLAPTSSKALWGWISLVQNHKCCAPGSLVAPKHSFTQSYSFFDLPIITRSLTSPNNACSSNMHHMVFVHMHTAPNHSLTHTDMLSDPHYRPIMTYVDTNDTFPPVSCAYNYTKEGVQISNNITQKPQLPCSVLSESSKDSTII
jgi:hypothetical protein